MERRDEHFNYWIAFCENVKLFSPADVIGRTEVEAYVSGTNQTISSEKIKHITNRKIELEKLVRNYKIVYELAAEVDLNVSKIYTEEGVRRYLLYLKSKIDSLQHSVKSNLDIEFIQGIYARLRVAEADPFFIAPPSNEVYDYMRACYDVFDLFNAFSEYINYLIMPGEVNTKQTDVVEIGGIDMNRLENDTHKLLLLHKLGLFEPLFKQYYNNEVPGMFNKLIGTLIGVKSLNNFRPQLSKFIAGFDKEHPNNEYKKVITPTAERKVNAFLAEIGLI